MKRKTSYNYLTQSGKFNFALFFTLLLISLLPTFYTTCRIFFLGNLPSDEGFNIASQVAWLSVLYEIIQEGLILPLFFLIGKSIRNVQEVENKVKTGIITSFSIYFIIAITIVILAKSILILLDQKPSIVDVSSSYIRIETVAMLFSVLYKFLSVVLIMFKRVRALLIILLAQMILTILADTMMISNLPISANIGVNGIAIGNLTINLVLFFIATVLVKKDHIYIFRKSKLSFAWQKEWFKIGSLSGIESLIRNLAFIVMVLKMINLVEEQGAFWLANSFIWGWLLAPIIALGGVIKQDIANNHYSAITHIRKYMVVTFVIIVIWIASVPLWKPFLATIMNINEYNSVFHIIILSLAFYITYAFNNAIDCIFYGLGRTDVMLIQSIIINVLYYGLFYIFYLAGVFVPTLDKIIILFGVGIVLDTILTFGIYTFMYQRKTLLKPIGYYK